METQLRATLDELAAEGLVVRERPLDTSARSRWPSDSLIRFYNEADEAFSDAEESEVPG